MDAVTGLAELTLQARDPAALAGFYGEAFGLEELAEGPVERDGDHVATLRG